MQHAVLLPLALALLPASGPAQGTCTSTVVFSEDFSSGVLPPGWIREDRWTIASSAPCAQACADGFYAFYGGGAFCDCTNCSGTGCKGNARLSSPYFALPAVGAGETLVLDFCYEGILDTGFGTCNELEIEHPGGTTSFKLGTNVFLPCPGPEFLPPFDLTPYAGQVVRLRWLAGKPDCEGTLWMKVDDVEVTHYAGGGGDCNANLVPDACDIALGTSPDCNANAVPDECDLAAGTETDCNNNSVPDSCEIAAGTSTDCNANGLPDECELIPSFNDCNGNGILDECDIASGTSNDFDGDGVPDECQCSTKTYCLSAPNSAGPGAQIAFSGSTSKTLNDTHLLVSGAPPGQIGIFYYGSHKAQAPFGNGWRCVGGSTVRLVPAVVLGPAGDGGYFLDLQGPPPAGQITPGQTWNFQFWYRDPLAGLAGFNLSDGLEITFCP